MNNQPENDNTVEQTVFQLLQTKEAQTVKTTLEKTVTDAGTGCISSTTIVVIVVVALVVGLWFIPNCILSAYGSSQYSRLMNGDTFQQHNRAAIILFFVLACWFVPFPVGWIGLCAMRVWDNNFNSP